MTESEEIKELKPILFEALEEVGKDYPFKSEHLDCYPSKITITEVENGFLVRVGCKEFVFESKVQLFNAIELYIEAPEEAEKKYCKE